ncbi:MAG: phage integrase SAM-like domain-containing protein [Bacillota bacterium]
MKKITMNGNLSSKTLKEGFKEFYRYCKIKYLSEATLEYHEESLKYFTRFIDKNTPIRSITKETIDNYILFLLEASKLNDTALNTRLRGIRTQMYYYMKMGYMKEFKIEMRKAEKTVNETYSDSELKL